MSHEATWDTTAPDMSGNAGRAWRWSYSDHERAQPQCAALIDTWLIHQPDSHPFWSWYVLCVVHLRGDMEGEPAVKHFYGAEYEVLVVALNPHEPVPEPKGLPGFDGQPHLPFLTPVDQCHQLPALPGGDSRARELCEHIVLAIVDGRLICDQDHRDTWRGTLNTTVSHIMGGLHP